jgi:iron(II)-dependent oxidoreductase
LLDTDAPIADARRMRQATAQVLSLALMDARNHTLRIFAAYERALLARDFVVPLSPELNPPLWELGHVAWFQEWWIGRNLQRPRGPRADPSAARLASIESNADRWYDSSNVPHDTRWQLDLPGLDATKQYLVATLESTLEMLDTADDGDDALYFYRLALFHEDMHGEAFVYMAQALGLDGVWPAAAIATTAPRAPLWFAPTRWRLGSDERGFSFDNERSAHDVEVPEFEIDAQPVTWAQYVEFVEDGGYDEPRWWSADGWAWAQQQARRCPRHVEQLRGGVLARRGSQLVRVPLAQPAMHLSWYEADAWCRWAGRRLPTEVEWELAAHQGASRGFRWGDVWEWTATTFRAYPGFAPDPYRDYSQPWMGGTHKVLRGASFATRARMKHPKYRNYYPPQRDDIFAGFRSCAT